MGVKATVYAFPSVLSIPAFAPMGFHIIAIGIAFVGATLLTLLFGFEDKKKKEASPDNKIKAGQPLVKQEALVSPLTGTIKALADVDDQVFASGAMGKGIAIEPTVGQAVSPVNGTVTTVFPTGHAIGITSDEGAEILIHIGLNTVQLEGKYYSSAVKKGEKVKQGDVLVNFNIEKIKEAGYAVTTPVIITNAQHYIDVIETSKKTVQAKEGLLTLVI
jgi:PTS system beta-glucosides-specific IIC component